jgi:hypothetical protein
MAINRPNDRFSNLAFRLQASTPPAIEHLSFASPDSCTESAAEPSSLEQAMIPPQAVMKDALSPHTPSPLPADPDATVTGTDIVYLADLQPQPVEGLWRHRLAAGDSISAFVAPKTENQVPGGGLCPIRRISTLRSTRQDAQINYLSTLSIFVKQTTYLATLPNKVRRLGKSHRIGAMATYGVPE